MKYNGYDVYDILYRNDGVVRSLLEKDILYMKTGLITLRDTDNRIWYLYKRANLLIPGIQEYLDWTYGVWDELPEVGKIKIGKDECEGSLPDADYAAGLFWGLSQAASCTEWGVEKRLWKLSGAEYLLYDVAAKTVKVPQQTDKVSILRGVYLSDRRTKRRNFTNFTGWKYITSYEMDSYGKIAMVPEKAAVSGKAAARDAASGASAGGTYSQKPLSGSAPAGAGTARPEAPSSAASSGAGMSARVTPPSKAVSVAVRPKQAARNEEAVPHAAPQAEAASADTAPQTAVADPVRSQAPVSLVAAVPEVGAKAAVPSADTLRDAVSADAGRADSGKAQKKAVKGIKDLLDCDKRRCRLESYEENMLYDIKRGHWDLYDGVEVAGDPEAGRLVPRDPRKDIRTGVVGIDFGTKSTVVVRQDDTNAIMPIRIGAAVLSAGLLESDYENPTIIECTDLDEFIRKYYEKPGRPETVCEDFFVSYDAYNGYRACPPNEFYAYYADLKQWSNHQKENVLVLDKQRKEYRFGVSGSREDKIINPIELYAYYIGLYINNMRNGIYMKYLMSFPVGYSKETRQLILTSFERGIRKSLPTCILEDEDCMKDFSVRLGISEPAAYAVTALEMSDLEPEDENDRYRYGIFDFGGGTADFGFGIWRGASEEEYDIEGYDYVLECFGADSDVTLGGENILELLGYAVFKKNRELARRKRLTCSLPFGEQAFLGSEALISNSQIAQRNMSILKEELRPLWHQEKGWEKKYRHESAGDSAGGREDLGYEEYIDLNMYDIDGKKQADCRFVIDTEELIALIKARIQKGIDAFFKCMSKAFQKEDELAGSAGKMYIFLAGNSSKSVFVKELFEAAIQDYSCGECFEFILKEPLGAENTRGQEYVPNAKTSVAYGLIKSREGSSIKVEKNLETDAEEQTRFKYYLGRERRRHFDCKLSPVETEYGTWVRFQGAAKQTVRIYYTTDPTADIKEGPPVIDNIPYKEITIEPCNNAYIFIRTCEPTAIEYTVSFSEERVGEQTEVYRLDFGM